MKGLGDQLVYIYIYINEEALLGEVSKKEIKDIFGRKTERNTVDFALFGPKVHLFGGKGKVRKKRYIKKSAKRDKRT